MRKLISYTAYRDVSSSSFNMDAVKSVHIEIEVPDKGTGFNTDTIALKAMVESKLFRAIGVITSKDNSIKMIEGMDVFKYWYEDAGLQLPMELNVKIFDL